MEGSLLKPVGVKLTSPREKLPRGGRVARVSPCNCCLQAHTCTSFPPLPSSSPSFLNFLYPLKLPIPPMENTKHLSLGVFHIDQQICPGYRACVSSKWERQRWVLVPRYGEAAQEGVNYCLPNAPTAPYMGHLQGLFFKRESVKSERHFCHDFWDYAVSPREGVVLMTWPREDSGGSMPVTPTWDIVQVISSSRLSCFFGQMGLVLIILGTHGDHVE